MRNKIISLFLSTLMLIAIISPSIEVVYAEGNNLPINTNEISGNKEEVNREDNFLTENLETMGSAEKATVGNNLTEIYLDFENGNDTNDGSVEHPVKTFAKAMDIINDGGTLNVLSLDETNITVNKQVKLNFLNDATMQGTGTAITLKGGAHLCVAEGKTLNINGYNKGILVEKGAEITTEIMF